MQSLDLSPFDDLTELVEAFTKPDILVQVALVGGCVAAAWLVAHLFFRRDPAAPRTLWHSRRAISGLSFPVLALLFVLLARLLLKHTMALPLMKLALPILASLVVVRLVARMLRAAFPQSALIRSLERSFSWLVWGAMVLWVTGLLPLLLREAEDVHWTLAGTTVTLRSLIEGALSAAAVLVAVMWLSSIVETRLLANVSGGNLSLRKIAANATRALLLVVGVLLALTAAGIPIGALSVFGGAIGVGIGLGLQKLAANYVSGFVVLAERSLRIGDVVKIDGFEGRITDIATRYTVLRALDGRESLVPNEMLITQRVENHSLADRLVAVTTNVEVAYGTDLDRLFPVLQAAVAATPRVLADPAPTVQLNAFTADGLGLRVSFWINDPENGTGGVRSDVNLAVLRTLTAQGVEIPYAHRVVELLGPLPAAAPPAQGAHIPA